MSDISANRMRMLGTLKVQMKLVRKILGWTQADLAENLEHHRGGGHIDQSHVSRWETGDRRPKLETIQAFREIVAAYADQINEALGTYKRVYDKYGLEDARESLGKTDNQVET